MSLRRRLTLSLFAILILFGFNVGTHFWGSFARTESMVAYRNSVQAAQLSIELEQSLNDQRQQILILDTLRENTDDKLDASELGQAEASLDAISAMIRELGDLSHDTTQQQYDQLWQSGKTLLDGWRGFYRNYNDPEVVVDISDPFPFFETSERLKVLEQRQTFIAEQRAAIIDRTITLTDRITVIGFLASIFLTSTLGFFLVRHTNSSLKRLKTGTERFGSGDLNYRIDNIDDSGELGDLAGAFNAMSDKLRNAITDVRQARDAADQANAAKSIFLANVSHELRTPLNAIIGYSEMLHDELDDEQPISHGQFQSDLDKIIVSGRQLLSLINDILDLSKIETGKMALHCENFMPGDIITEVCDALSPLLQAKGNRLILEGITGLPALHNDATKFRQIFVNLLSNACKFTDQGLITLAASTLDDKPGWLEFKVTDTGIGMNEEQQTRVFDAFEQAENATSSTYGGTGLGLAICQDFCQLMGGTIRVESEPGKGSTFTVALPPAPESARAAA